MKSNHFNFAAAVLLLLFVSLGCKTLMSGKENGQKAVNNFHALYNDGKFAEIYDQSSREFQQAESKAKIENLLGAVQRKLGKAGKTDFQGWNVNTNNGVTTVTITCETEYERGRATEKFVFVGDDLKLLSFNINSDQLKTE